MADGLQHAGLLPTEWKFASGNLGLIIQSIDIYSLSSFWAVTLFVAVIVAQLGSAVLFWRAFLDRDSLVDSDGRKALHAFSLATGLFGAFLVADEIFIVYARFAGVETTHLLIFCALLLSYLVIHPHRRLI